jgi:hypothetical protein
LSNTFDFTGWRISPLLRNMSLLFDPARTTVNQHVLAAYYTTILPPPRAGFVLRGEGGPNVPYTLVALVAGSDIHWAAADCIFSPRVLFSFSSRNKKKTGIERQIDRRLL